MEAKFTKGPWEIAEVRTQVGRAFKIDEEARHEDHGLVACIYDDETSLNSRLHEEHEANAHLIAAAPEMYEALEGLIALNRSPGPSPAGEITKRLNAGDAALAKARGET